MKKIFLLFVSIFAFYFSFSQCPQRYNDVVFSNIKTTYNINYGGLKQHIDGNARWLMADMYEPANDTANLRPLFFMIHGGGFLDLPIVDKQSPDIVELATDLAKRGYLVVSPEYRLAADPLALLSTERMAQTVISGMVDINEAICFFYNSALNGNPYKIDTSKIIVGGVSAGAVLVLQGLYVDDTAELDPFYRNISNRVGAFDNKNMQQMLQNKFCGANILGGIAVSGAVLDSNFIKYKKQNILLIHGTTDGIVPWGVAKPFGLPTLPLMYGSGSIYNKIKKTGTVVEFDSYPGLNHVPFMWLDPSKWIQNFSLWNQPILDSTKNHIAHFSYNMIGKPITRCNTITAIKNNISGTQLAIFPNPNNGKFSVELPKEISNKPVNLQIKNMLGQIIFEENYKNNFLNIDIGNIEKGFYTIQLSSKIDGNIEIYTDKISVK